MPTKKLFLSVLATAALALSSCSSDDDIIQIPSNSIPSVPEVAFSTYTGNSTAARAEIMDNSMLKKEGFGVFGLLYAEDETVSSNGWLYNFFANQQVTWDNPTLAWTYSPIKYWPTSTTDNMTILAYAPYCGYSSASSIDGMFLTSDKTKGEPLISYKVAEDVKKGIDLVYDHTKKDITKPANGQLDFKFKHALARISFEVAQSPSMEGSIVLDKVVFRQTIANPVCVKGSFNLYRGDWISSDNAYDQSASWSWDANSLSNLDIKDDMPSKVKEDSYLMVIPTGLLQEFDVEISYIHTIMDSNLPEGKIEPHNTATAIVAFEPCKGKAYSWRFLLKGDKAEMSGSTSDWN